MEISAESLTPRPAVMRGRMVAATVHGTVALLVGLTGIADMIATLMPRTHLGDLLLYWPLSGESVLSAFGVVVGFGLLMLARGLARGKRHAWQITIILLILSLLWQFTRGHVLVALWLGGLVSLLVGSLAPFFRAKSDPPSLWRGYGALIGGGIIVYLYALGGTLVLEHRLAPIESLERVANGLQHLIDDMPVIKHHVTHALRLWIFERTLAVVTCAAFLYGLAEILRPALSLVQRGHDDRPAVAQLVRRHGANTVTAFALAPEKRHFLTKDGRAAVAYAVAERIAVVAGDPIAAPEDLAAALDEFARWCRDHDLQPAFWQARDVYLDHYRALGWQTLKIGEEAVVDLPAFTLKGGAMQNVRTTLRHAEKAGVSVRFFRGAIGDPALAAGVDALSRAWLATKGGSEMGFSMGRWTDTYLPERVIAVAVAADGAPLAFTTFVPVPGRDGWALDLMRRTPQSVAGTMELLLVRAIERFRDEGAAILSLGLAPLANANGEPLTNIGQVCCAFSSRFGSNKQAASLVAFKRKFGPRWESRYIVYPGTLALPRVGLAILSAHLCRSWRAAIVPRALCRARLGTARIVGTHPTRGARG
jgi:phosphatidylglycerol lysyltransferase